MVGFPFIAKLSVSHSFMGFPTLFPVTLNSCGFQYKTGKLIYTLCRAGGPDYDKSNTVRWIVHRRHFSYLFFSARTAAKFIILSALAIHAIVAV